MGSFLGSLSAALASFRPHVRWQWRTAGSPFVTPLLMPHCLNALQDRGRLVSQLDLAQAGVGPRSKSPQGRLTSPHAQADTRLRLPANTSPSCSATRAQDATVDAQWVLPACNCKLRADATIMAAPKRRRVFESNCCPAVYSVADLVTHHP